MLPENDLVLRDTQNWAARSHRELYDSVHHFNDPGQAGEIGSEWAQFGAELTESAQLITKRVAASESGWTGAAAEGARAAIRGLAEWITLTAKTAVEVGDRVAAQGRIMAAARATMPEPPNFSLDAAARGQSDPGLAGFTASAADIQAASEKARAAHEQAVTVMETMEKQSHEIDASTPAFTPPYNPVTGKAEEPPQPMMLRSTGGPSLSGASGAPVVGTQSAPDSSAPPPSPSGAPPVAPAATYSGPSGSPSPEIQQPSYQPAAHHSPGDSTAVAAASAPSYQPQSYSAPSAGGYSAPAEQRPASYGVPPWAPPQSAPRTSTSGAAPRTSTSTSGTAPRTSTGTPGAPRPVPNADPHSAVRPTTTGPTGSGGAGGGARPGVPAGPGGSGGFGGGGGAGRGGFPAGQFTSGGQSGGAPMQAGGAAGVTSQGRGPVPAGGVGPGAAAAAGAGQGAAGGPMGGPASGKGEEDKEHRAASYLMAGDLFEVPGENLPPSVIGGAKPKKKPSPEPSP